MSYTKQVEQYIHTETVIYDENGEEVFREENNDAYWYDTKSVTELTEEEAKREYL